MTDEELKSLQEEIAMLIENEELDENLGKLIDEVFEQSITVEELQKSLIKTISAYLINKNRSKTKKKEKEEELEIFEDIEKFVDDILEKNGIDKTKHKMKLDQIKARKNLKMIIKNFAIYQIYKVMNPKRIAGETKKMNYMHNLAKHGKKTAAKYEGGRPQDLAKYGKAEVKNIHKAAKSAKKSLSR
ncbi:MAG: hypothetical protein DGJ47_000823 [Rickettsiaceae bacterium]